MKKYVTLLLVAIMLLAVLVSCGAAEGSDGAVSQGGAVDSISGGDGASKPDAPLDPTESRADTDNSAGAENGDDSHKNTETGSSVIKPNEDVDEKPTEPPSGNGGEGPSSEPTEKIHTAYWQLNYAYGYNFIGEASVTRAELLIEHSRLGRGFENIAIPHNAAAGDIIVVEYTGETEHLEQYPEIINLKNGEVKAYSFNYAEVTHLKGDEFSIEKIKACFDFEAEYVILDRSGKFVKLDEYSGDEIYLVTDQKKLYGGGLNDTQALKALLKHPVACMLAYNPRDLEDGIPVKDVAELRNEKVTFDLNLHDLGLEQKEKEQYKDKTKFDLGYIGINEKGSRFLEYAPNVYSYAVLIQCNGNSLDAKSVVRYITDKYFHPTKSEDDSGIYIDCQLMPNNQILMVFPNFDTYFACQEELLDGLCGLACVKSVYVSYVASQCEGAEVKEPYEIYAELEYFSLSSTVFTTYEEYIIALDKYVEGTQGLKEITEKTFENSYVFVVEGDHWREFDISDARLVDDTVYFTFNAYEEYGMFGNDIKCKNSYVLVLPKEEIGDLPKDVSVKTVDVTIYVDTEANFANEIDIMTNIFLYLDKNNYGEPLPKDFAYAIDFINGKYDYYWYVHVYPIYVGDSDPVDIEARQYICKVDRLGNVIFAEVME